MTDAVVDASALVFALTTRSASAMTLSNRLGAIRCHAPHLVDAECGHALRGLVRRGELTAAQGHVALDAAAGLIDARFPHDRPLRDDAWALRHRLTFYDALYVALAARLDVPLVTADKRRANAPGLPCVVELVG